MLGEGGGVVLAGLAAGAGALGLDAAGGVVFLEVRFFRASEPPHHIEDFVLLDFHPDFEPSAYGDHVAGLVLCIFGASILLEVFVDEAGDCCPVERQVLLK